ncbi:MULTISPECIES: FliH/SctL family protein [Halanaerobium]|uniref:Flagellar assembly protein FliH n=1 Tax=Halanaerobium kushneri TaxID=56779 RepID=A0A1N6UDD3_9FIRM|nr:MULTISPECIES: FliH/SctL family protein [Halanaerobium]RCW53361.1 flagellar assembly protein FliH [Halanaerobium sp. ST460_2HS_T2]SIQ63604.1 flagellar assembly protein FliH [Halanaerobium kushneri]
MSKVIKASQVTGKYKISQKPKTISLNNDDRDESFSKEENKANKINSNKNKILSQAEKKADKIIKEAEKEAETIIEQAKSKKEKILSEKDKIYQETKDEARKEGLAEAESQIEKKEKQLVDLISSFEREFEKEKSSIRKDVIELAVKIASIVIDVKLETEHDMINNIISDMLRKVDDNHRDIVVRVNPQLLPYIEENRFYQHINQKNIEFISDPELRKGDCVVETNLGGKEGSLDHKLDLIKTELLKEVEQHD